MSKKRRRYSGDFKAKVALAVLKGDQATSELAARFEVHPSMVKLLGISRSSLCYQHRELLAEDLMLMRLIDEQHLRTPVYGPRRMTAHLNRLRGLTIDRPNQVWTTDVSYLPLARGFMSLVAVMDWHSRRILSWRVSNTLDTDFCGDALEEALARYGPPEIFITDQGCQLTSQAFTGVLEVHDVQISMDGRGCYQTTSLWSDSGAA